jgi:hypothetical protein
LQQPHRVFAAGLDRAAYGAREPVGWLCQLSALLSGRR